MLIDELKNIARNNGIVGAGGAGFPAYAKMTEKADTVILNCVECEPLLKLHRQLLATHTEEIIRMLDEVRESFGAKEAVLGIKSEYVTTIKAIEEVIGDFPNVRICAEISTWDLLLTGPKIRTFSIALNFNPTIVHCSLDANCPPINSFFFVS